MMSMHCASDRVSFMRWVRWRNSWKRGIKLGLLVSSSVKWAAFHPKSLRFKSNHSQHILNKIYQILLVKFNKVKRVVNSHSFVHHIQLCWSAY